MDFAKEYCSGNVWIHIHKNDQHLVHDLNDKIAEVHIEAVISKLNRKNPEPLKVHFELTDEVWFSYKSGITWYTYINPKKPNEETNVPRFSNMEVYDIKEIISYKDVVIEEHELIDLMNN